MKSLVIPKCSSLTFTPFQTLLLVAGKISFTPIHGMVVISHRYQVHFKSMIICKEKQLVIAIMEGSLITVMCFLIRPTDASVTVTPPSACQVRRKMAATRTWCAVASTTRPVETVRNASRSIMTVHGPAPPPTMPMNAFVSQMCSFISSTLCVRRRNSLLV